MKTVITAHPMSPVRLDVPVHPAILRNIGWRVTKRNPSLVSASSPRIVAADRDSGRRDGSVPDHQQGRDREHVARRVGANRLRGADRRHQRTSGSRARDGSNLRRRGQLAVAVSQLILGQKQRQIALIRDVEEHRADAGQKGGGVQLAEASDRPGRRRAGSNRGSRVA